MPPLCSVPISLWYGSHLQNASVHPHLFSVNNHHLLTLIGFKFTKYFQKEAEKSYRFTVPVTLHMTITWNNKNNVVIVAVSKYYFQNLKRHSSQ